MLINGHGITIYVCTLYSHMIATCQYSMRLQCVSMLACVRKLLEYQSQQTRTTKHTTHVCMYVCTQLWTAGNYIVENHLSQYIIIMTLSNYGYDRSKFNMPTMHKYMYTCTAIPLHSVYMYINGCWFMHHFICTCCIGW